MNIPKGSTTAQQLEIAVAALDFARRHTLSALEEGPSLLLLDAAINDAKTALAFLMKAAKSLEEPRGRYSKGCRAMICLRN
jgi:hypothetical protein